MASRKGCSPVSTSYVEWWRLRRSMPRPVEALPCGSRSTISTSSPMAASAVPRLIAVVVLPTPPFWLAMARIRGGLGTPIRVSRIDGGSSGTRGDLSGAASSLISSLMGPMSLVAWLVDVAAARLKTAYNHDLRLLIRSTCDQARVNFPIFSGVGQFRRHILTLGKQRQSASFQQRVCECQQFRQWRQGPRSNNVDGFGRFVHKVLDPHGMHDARRSGSLHSLAQKRCLFAYAFDQVDVCAVRSGERARDHDTRKTGA